MENCTIKANVISNKPVAKVENGKKLKKKTKAALKKEKRAQKHAEEQRIRDLIQTAKFSAPNKPRNVLDDCKAFSKFDRNGLDLELVFRDGLSCKADAVLSDEVYDIAETNMMKMYEENEWTWTKARKSREIFHEDARMIIAKCKESGKTAGFINFRFLLEDACPVLYVYELQVKKSFARKGLGRHLMLTAELIANKYKLEWVMLTVFKSNAMSQNFFRGLRYQTDETSPQFSFEEMFDPEVANYDILSKKTRFCRT